MIPRKIVQTGNTKVNACAYVLPLCAPRCSPGLGCTGTGSSYIVGHVGPSTSHQARLQIITKWRRPKASAMPDPHVYLNFIVDLLRFFLVDQRLLIKKCIFWTYLQFFQRA